MSTNQKKVSLLSPCYNVEKYISDFLDSILEQKFDSLEVILVDDGSTDNTPQIIESYRKPFEKSGITLLYLRKENGGQASAMSVGLPYVTGKYLIWPDSDDILLPDSIKTRVEYMDLHPECGIVRSNGYLYMENDLVTTIGTISKKTRKNSLLNDFVRFIVPWCSGCYMIRMSALDDVNPKRFVYNSKCGQNIQMLLPIVSKYPCHYLDEYLYGYINHPNSHSHKDRGYEYASQHIDDMRDCVVHTLGILDGDYTEYIMVHDKFNRRVHFETAWKYQKLDEMQKYEHEMRKKDEFYFDYWLMKRIKPDSRVCSFLKWATRIRRYIFRQGI